MTAPSRFPNDHANDDYCYLLTTGRKSGLERETEIWFAIQNGVLFVMAGSGERAYWVRNLRANPELDIRLGGERFPARVRDLAGAEEDALARRLLVEKYQPRYASDLSAWGRTALPLAFDAR